MKAKIAMIVAMLSSGTMGVWAQNQVEVHLGADIVSNYIWRGQDMGHVSLQPELSVGWKGLSLSAWGSVGLSNKDDAREVDLTLSYETGNLSFGIVDYWNDGDGKPYFCYKNYNTAHSFEGFINYDFGPVSASWQTYFTGSDYRADGKRAYSSYFELSAPFRLATCDWDARFGLVPWKSGMYDASGISVTNLSLRVTKAIRITRSFELPLFGQVVANPASRHFYFVFGLTLKAI
ncbi:MAG: hypothetical protein IK144_13035 [Bacteroidaceae bacterium]|nr:hypothetical protein [Bacteroidaceae bacterium]